MFPFVLGLKLVCLRSQLLCVWDVCVRCWFAAGVLLLVAGPFPDCLSSFLVRGWGVSARFWLVVGLFAAIAALPLIRDGSAAVLCVAATSSAATGLRS